MIRTIFIVIFWVTLLVITSSVQNVFASEAVHDEVINILLEKKALVEQEIPFTETEAEQFWPLYNEYEKELRPTINDTFTLLVEVAESKNVSKGEINDFIDQIIEKQKLSAELHSEYAKRFNDVLSPDKTLILLGILLAF